MSKREKSETFSGLSVEKLREKLVFFKKELFNLRFQKSLGELSNTSRFSVVKKSIARVNTELTKKKAVESK
jgi:large subunit ribosomal protein L29